MNRSRALLLSILALAVCTSAHADPAREAEPPAAAGVQGRRAWVPERDVPAPPEQKSAAPTKQEWAAAAEATEVRITDPGCKALRVREWYRIECDTTHVGLVSGARTDLEVARSEAEGKAWMVFPARRGDRRVAVFMRMVKWGYAPDTLVSEQWLEGDEAPLITVLGVI